MFEDSLFDSGAGTRTRKTWPKVISYFAEACAVGILVLLPLIYTQALPKQQLMSFLEAPSPPPGRAPVQAESQPRVQPRMREKDGALHEPGYIPRTVSMAKDEPTTEGPPSMDGLVPGSVPNGVPNAVLTEMARAVPPTVVKPAPQQKLRISSGVAAGMLVLQVKPQYPRLAMQARVQGTVVLQAVIGKDGTVHDLRLISGHPLLTPAAIEAVKQWRYRPYLLNNEPVEVDTQVNVNFTLGGG
jgi:periplasmic protein TonB